MLVLVWLSLCFGVVYGQDFFNINLNLAVATESTTSESPTAADVTTGDTVTEAVTAGDTVTEDVTAEETEPTTSMDTAGMAKPTTEAEEVEEEESGLMLRPTDVSAGLLVPCDRDAATNPCNATDLERCVLLRERDARCVCLPGFSRGRDGLSCVAVKAFSVRLPLANVFSSSLYDTSSTRYRTAEFNAREAIFQAAMASDLRNIAEDVDILSFKRVGSDTDPGSLVVEANILISRAYAPDLDMVRSDLLKGLQATLRPGAPDGGFFLGTTGLYVSAEAVNATLEDPNPCDNPLLNYCSVDGGACTRTARSFVCACKDGYEDVSPNQLEAPGEVCEANCNCQNGGECLVNAHGQRYCRCPSWFLGYHCEINGETLLIVMCCVIGVIVIIGIITCVCCIHKVHQNDPKRYPDGSVIEEIPRSESNYRGYKMRRPYVDPWNKNNVYSPNSSHYPQYVSYWTNDGQSMAPPAHYAHSGNPALSIPRPRTMASY